MKEVKLINSSELKNQFTADDLISLGFKYQRDVAVPYVVGKSLRVSYENGKEPEYDNLDRTLKNIGLEDGERVYIRLDK